MKNMDKIMEYCVN